MYYFLKSLNIALGRISKIDSGKKCNVIKVNDISKEIRAIRNLINDVVYD